MIIRLMLFALISSGGSADDVKKKGRGTSAWQEMNAWQGRLPDEVRKKMPADVRDLLDELGYDSDALEDKTRRSYSVQTWGNDFSNFDDDGTKDWVIQVRTRDFHGRAICGVVIYDRTGQGWTCVAKLPGSLPIGWNHTKDGRSGICTREPAPDESPPAVREYYFRWNGNRYVEEKVKLKRGG